jgi:hypothetical protein
VSATNYQGSAAASCAGKFTVLEGGAPGDIEVGECGVRTITEDQLGNVQQGSAADAQSTGGADAPRALPLPKVDVLAASVTPVPGAPIVPLALALGLALGVSLVRRWSS